ncbi:MAG: class I SAM-dependent methyltransferase [Lachnospiraceae bacterium]|nr:class I SAM-dependent methyltransferase [Lachnospiraceae bacterium]
MEAYTSFAEVYDEFMDNVPYESWCEFIIERLKEYGIVPEKNGERTILCDLGCGTGAMTRLLSKKGFDMIGIDNSSDMLDIAREYEYEEENGILYLMQDMREFELYGTVAAIVSSCDSINYVTDPKEMLKVFKLANNYLESEGLFIFDFHPRGYFKRLGSQTFAEDREDISFIWDNTYDDRTGINEYNLKLFFGREDGLYEKYEETHYQYAYELQTIKELVETAGMELLKVYGGYEDNDANEDSDRIVVIAREKHVEGKLYI